jgi:hypothetical protein
MRGPWDALVPYLRTLPGINEGLRTRIWLNKAPQNAGTEPYMIVTGPQHYDNGHHTTGVTKLKKARFKIIGVSYSTPGAQVIRSACQTIVDHLSTVIGQNIGPYRVSGFWLDSDLYEGWVDAPDSDEQGIHTEVLPFSTGFYFLGD